MAIKKRKSGGGRSIEANRSADTPVIYANNIQIDVSVWDFKFKFGQVVNVTPESLVVDEKAYVYMSPPHAKAFLKIFSTMLREYESKFGQVYDQINPGGLPIGQ